MGCRIVATAIALLALSLGAGCSGEETEDDYVEDANTICAELVDQFPDPSSIDPGSPAADQAIRRLTTARGRAIRRLRALEPPREDAATVAKMLRQLAKSQRLLKEAVRLGESEMVVPTLIAAAREDDEAHEAARTLGLDDCARL